MSINRVFLDWTRPALAAAVEWLVERFSAAGQLDLRKVVVALPGGRAGRRLLEILVAGPIGGICNSARRGSSPPASCRSCSTKRSGPLPRR